ncbi:MAG: hypothetical protein R3Y57_05555 [Erysipelotrichaceae bacterium]
MSKKLIVVTLCLSLFLIGCSSSEDTVVDEENNVEELTEGNHENMEDREMPEMAEGEMPEDREMPEFAEGEMPEDREMMDGEMMEGREMMEGEMMEDREMPEMVEGEMPEGEMGQGREMMQQPQEGVAE